MVGDGAVPVSADGLGAATGAGVMAAVVGSGTSSVMGVTDGWAVVSEMAALWFEVAGRDNGVSWCDQKETGVCGQKENNALTPL